MNGPHWIKQWIADLALLNEQFRDENGTVDFEALGREEFLFRTALITRNFSKSERAKTVFDRAKAAYIASSENGKRGGRPRKSTADGDTREDSQDIATSGNGSVTESGTSANIYGDAPHREAVDESATISNNYGARQAEARQSQRAGGNSLRVAKVSTSPARSSGPMPEDKQAVMDYASAAGLDIDDAYECWHVTVNERGGLTADNKPINNWKAYVRKWCETRAKRRTA
jgi:hypothetical protein